MSSISKHELCLASAIQISRLECPTFSRLELYFFFPLKIAQFGYVRRISHRLSQHFIIAGKVDAIGNHAGIQNALASPPFLYFVLRFFFSVPSSPLGRGEHKGAAEQVTDTGWH
jgi:hypothetical protein